MDFKLRLEKIIKEYPYNITQKVKKETDLKIQIEQACPARTLGESIYIFINGDKDRYSTCGKEMDFNGFSAGYKKSCSKSTKVCACRLEQKQNAMKKAYKTFEDRTGHSHPSNSSDTIDNKKKNNKEKYGVENVSQLDWVQDKKEATCLKNHGATSYLSTTESDQSLINYNQKLFGVNYRSQSKEGKNEICASLAKHRRASSSVYRNLKVYDIVRDKTMLQNLLNEFHNPLVIAKELDISPSYMFACLRDNDLQFDQASAPEAELKEYIASIYKGEIVSNSKSLLGDRSEIDIFLPSLNIGFEFNGTYWHSTAHKDRLYHKNKSKKAAARNIDLIHVHASDWDTKKEIVKNRIRHKLNACSSKIYARKCKLREITPADARKFCEDNHLFGFAGAAVHLGLFCDNILVSYMSFCSPRRTTGNYDYELLRFVSSVPVIGGASKLFKFFIKKYTPTSIYSYSDNDWNSGALYDVLGFSNLGQTAPGYWYIDTKSFRHNRRKYQKHLLVDQGYDVLKSEMEIMTARGFFVYYDSGNTTWEWVNPDQK